MTDVARLLEAGERLIVAAASRNERVVDPAERDRPGWYEPAHIRDALATRQAQLEQAEAGAHVLVAQTFRTNRRKLARYGVARRAREWTLRGVDVAREAAKAAEDAGWGVAPPGGSARILVAGAVPELEADGGGGVDEATALGEHREHVGHLAEAGVDLLLVEPMATLEEARAASLAAVETALPTFTAVLLDRSADRLSSGEPLEAWLEVVVPLAPAALLLDCLDPCALGAALARAAVLAPLRTGVYSDGSRLGDTLQRGDTRRQSGGGVPGESGSDEPVGGPDENGQHGLAALARRWLDEGASILGLADGATPARVVQLGLALDERRREERERRDAARARWLTWVIEAARRAPGGAAVWIEQGREREGTEPAGFEWLRVPEEELRVLPEGRYGLVVSATPSGDLRQLAGLLVEGGVLLARTLPYGSWSTSDLDVVEVVDEGAERIVLARRTR